MEAQYQELRREFDDFKVSMTGELNTLRARLARLEPQQPRIVSLDAQESNEPAEPAAKPAEEEAPEVEKEFEREASLTHVAELLSQDGYELPPSVWHGSVFIGLKIFGPGGSLFMLFAVALNMMMSGIFVYVLYNADDNFLKNENPTADEMLAFRTAIGHDIGYANFATESSLAARVCNKDNSLTLAGTQTDMVKMARSYAGYDGTDPIGMMLSCLCILIWYLNVVPDLSDCYYFVASMRLLPRGDRTVISVAKDGGGLQLTQLHPVRMLLVVLVSVVRFAVMGTVLVMGGVWLAKTTMLENLVLNAGALTCLKVDELLWSILAPRTAQKALETIEPIDMPPRWGYKGVGLKAIVTALMGIVLVGACYTEILESRDSLVGALDALCSGDRNFVVATDTVGAFMWAPTTDVESPTDSQERVVDYREEIVLNIMNSGLSCHEYSNSTANSVLGRAKAVCDGSNSAFQTLNAFTYSTMADLEEDYGMYCEEDPLDDAPTHWKERLATVVYTDMEHLSCANVSQYCDGIDESYRLVRAMCAVSCGCASPMSGLITTDGCPTTCKVQASYLAEKEQFSCHDTALEDMQQLATWNKFVDGYNVLSGSNHGDALNLYGCPYVEIWPEVFCTDGHTHYSMALLCPVACRCHKVMADTCPPLCAMNVSHDFITDYNDTDHHHEHD